MFRTNESDPWRPHLSTCVIYLCFYQNVPLRYSFFLSSSHGVIGPKGAAVKRLQTPQQTFKGIVELTPHWLKIVLGRSLVQTCALLLRYSIYVTLLIHDSTILPPQPPIIKECLTVLKHPLVSSSLFLSSPSLSASFVQESPGGELASPLTPVTPPMENINGTDEICDTTPNSDSLPGPAQNALAFAHRYISHHDALTVARYRICCSRDFTV